MRLMPCLINVMKHVCLQPCQCVHACCVHLCLHVCMRESAGMHERKCPWTLCISVWARALRHLLEGQQLQLLHGQACIVTDGSVWFQTCELHVAGVDGWTGLGFLHLMAHLFNGTCAAGRALGLHNRSPLALIQGPTSIFSDFVLSDLKKFTTTFSRTPGNHLFSM